MLKRLFVRIKELRFYLTSLTRLIYPSFCLFCDEPLKLTQNYSCYSCLQKLPVLKKPVCKKCAAELPLFAFPTQICSPCRNAKTSYDSGTAYFRYEDKIKSVFQNIKFVRKSWHLKIFKQFLQDASFPLPLSEYDVIVPVPLDQNRIQTREFNQSELIAKFIGRLEGAPPVRNLLKKIKKTSPQSSLHRKERLNNLTQAFQIRRNENITGKKILVVDDIVTTGATINECARTLKTNGAERVDFFALARTTHLLN